MQKREQLELTLKKNSRENEQAAQAIEKGGCPRVAITSKYLRIQRILEPIQFFFPLLSLEVNEKGEWGSGIKCRKKECSKHCRKIVFFFFLQQLRNSKCYAISTWGNYFPTWLKKLNLQHFIPGYSLHVERKNTPGKTLITQLNY